MGTFDPNAQPPAPEPAEAPENPWAPYEQAGIDPTKFTPDALRNGGQLWQALGNRDYRDPALTQLLRGDLLQEGESLEDIRRIVREYREAQQDPWQQMGAEDQPEYYDPRTGEPVYAPEPQQAQFDPRALQGAVQQTVKQQLEAWQRQQSEQQAQQAREMEFKGELDRRAEKGEWEDFERNAVAGYAYQASHANPYASTKELFDIAEKAYQAVLDKRLASLAERQQAKPRMTTPTGPAPAESAPKTFEEVEEAFRRAAAQRS